MLDSLSKRLGLNKNNYNKQEKILILKYIIDQMLDVTRKHKSILLFVNLDLSPSSKETFNKISSMKFDDGIFFIDATPDTDEKIDRSDLIIKFDGHPNKQGKFIFWKKIFEFINKKSLLF